MSAKVADIAKAVNRTGHPVRSLVDKLAMLPAGALPTKVRDSLSWGGAR
jgi:hypothetical protein